MVTSSVDQPLFNSVADQMVGIIPCVCKTKRKLYLTAHALFPSINVGAPMISFSSQSS
jgi:hypothetical protein